MNVGFVEVHDADRVATKVFTERVVLPAVFPHNFSNNFGFAYPGCVGKIDQLLVGIV